MGVRGWQEVEGGGKGWLEDREGKGKVCPPWFHCLSHRLLGLWDWAVLRRSDQRLEVLVWAVVVSTAAPPRERPHRRSEKQQNGTWKDWPGRWERDPALTGSPPAESTGGAVSTDAALGRRPLGEQGCRTRGCFTGRRLRGWRWRMHRGEMSLAL